MGHRAGLDVLEMRNFAPAGILTPDLPAHNIDTTWIALFRVPNHQTIFLSVFTSLHKNLHFKKSYDISA